MLGDEDEETGPHHNVILRITFPYFITTKNLLHYCTVHT